MKKSFLRRTVLVPVFTLIISSALIGCGQTGEEGTENNKSPAYGSQDSSHSDMDAAVSSGQEDGMTDDTETEEFREAVENNPALEGWNTKMVLINSMD